MAHNKAEHDSDSSSEEGDNAYQIPSIYAVNHDHNNVPRTKKKVSFHLPLAQAKSDFPKQAECQYTYSTHDPAVGIHLSDTESEYSVDSDTPDSQPDTDESPSQSDTNESDTDESDTKGSDIDEWHKNNTPDTLSTQTPLPQINNSFSLYTPDHTPNDTNVLRPTTIIHASSDDTSQNGPAITDHKAKAEQSLLLTNHKALLQDNNMVPPPIHPFKGEDHLFSNFYPIPQGIWHNNMRHKTVEHAYQTAKALHHGRLDLIPLIQACDSALQVLKLVKSNLYHCVQHSWHQIKHSIMHKLIQLKIESLPSFKQALLDTTGTIVETTKNLYWASGLSRLETLNTLQTDWPGDNNLGNILMDIRQKERVKLHLPPAPTPKHTIPPNAKQRLAQAFQFLQHKNDIVLNENISSDLHSLYQEADPQQAQSCQLTQAQRRLHTANGDYNEKATVKCLVQGPTIREPKSILKRVSIQTPSRALATANTNAPPRTDQAPTIEPYTPQVGADANLSPVPMISSTDMFSPDPTNDHVPRYNLRSNTKALPTTRKLRTEKQRLASQAIHLPAKITEITGITIEDIKQGQHKDMFCAPLINYLVNQMVPSDPTEANNLLNIANHYLMNEGVLYCLHYYTKRSGRDSILKLVVPANLVKQIVQISHITPYSAHQGITKTIMALKEQYYWPNLALDVRDIISSCDRCLAFKRSQRTENPLLTLFEQTTGPWEHVCIDLMGPLTLTPNKNLFIGVVVDLFSRYVVAFPLRNKSANHFAYKFYTHVIAIYGCMKRIHSDQGPEFINYVMAELTKMHGIIQTHNSGYSPHSSGLAEAAVKRITSALRTVVNAKGDNWDTLLPQLCFCLNTFPVNCHAHSPYLLMFGKLPYFPHSHLSRPNIDDLDLRSTVVRDLLKTQTLVYEEAVKTHAKTNAKMKRYYDRTRTPSKVAPGLIVYLKVPIIHGEHNRKLTRYFRGPYIICDVLPRDKVTMKNLQTNVMYKEPIHVSRLKLATHYNPHLAFRDF